MNELHEPARKAAGAQETFDRVQFEVIRDGIRFFERLAFFNAGAIVLSITFFGYLSSRPPSFTVDFIGFLHFAWGVFVIGLLSSLLRNYFHSQYLYHATFADWAEEEVAQKQSSIELVQQNQVRVVDKAMQPIDRNKVVSGLETDKETWQRAGTRSRGKAARFWKLQKACHYGAVGSLVVGILLLLFFAVGNTL